MNFKNTLGVRSDFVGVELEEVYAKVLGGRVVGGFNDAGKDVVLNNSQVGVIQVKSSIKEAIRFLSNSLRFGRFIPICIGEPGSCQEVMESLIKFGAWIDKGFPQREQALMAISQVRQQIGT